MKSNSPGSFSSVCRVLINSGYTLETIGEMFQHHRGTISRELKRMGIKPARTERAEKRREQIENVLDQYGEGTPIEFIAQQTGIPRSTVHRHRQLIRRDADAIRNRFRSSYTAEDVKRWTSQ